MEYTCSYEGEVQIDQPKSENLPHGGGAKAVSRENLSTEGREILVTTGCRKFFISIKVPVATLCHCSKAISEYGAHNQRGFVKVKVLYSKFFWIEDVIKMIENCASTPLYSVLKRQDEKFVTEHAYDNPRFVEDVVREVYLGLKKMDFKWFTVEAETEESIHFHNAYACAEYSE